MSIRTAKLVVPDTNELAHSAIDIEKRKPGETRERIS